MKMNEYKKGIGLSQIKVSHIYTHISIVEWVKMKEKKKETFSDSTILTDPTAHFGWGNGRSKIRNGLYTISL